MEAIFAKGSPIALETNGIVLEALGLTSNRNISRQGGKAVGFNQSDINLGNGSNNLSLDVASGLSSVGIDESSLISGNGNDSMIFSIASNSGISNIQRSN